MTLRRTAAVAVGLLLSVVAAPPAWAFTPDYGKVSGEPVDARYDFRAMPALHWVDYAGGGRFLRSFQDGPDDGSLRTRIQYHAGGSMTDPANWVDVRAGGGLLRDVTSWAKVNNAFRSTNGNTVVMNEKVIDNKIGRHESSDGGVSWAAGSTTVDMTDATVTNSEMRAFQRVIRLPDDGALVMPLYAEHAKNRWGAHLIVSEKEGADWKRAATVFFSSDRSYTESTVTQLKDGELRMIARYDYMSGGLGYVRLATRVTTGRVGSAADLRSATWGPWEPVRVPGSGDEPVRGVAPLLNTMANGVLMLTYGRPGNNVAFSHDGGKTWDQPYRLYENIPTAGCPKGDSAKRIPFYPCDSFGSSGYMGIAVTSPSSAYVIGDNCQAYWGCLDENHKHPHGIGNNLWYRVLKLK